MLSQIYRFILNLFQLNNQYLRYIIPILLILVAIPIYFGLKFLIIYFISLYISKKSKIEKSSLKQFFIPFQKKFLFLFFIVLAYFISNPLIKNQDIKKYFNYGFSIFLSIGLAQIFISLFELILNTKFFEHFDKTETKKGIKTINFIVKIIVWLITILFCLNIIGIKITNLLAGLGISGVIIALATQSIFNDLFSYFSILADKPFEVGDFISYDNLSGTVEYIGIKSTRIRILDGELLIIPNTILVGSKLRNFKSIEKRRAFVQLKIPINISTRKLEKLILSIKNVLTKYENVELERCFITTISDMVVQLDTYYYVKTKEFMEFLEIKHRINIEILKILQKEKIRVVSNISSIDFLKDNFLENKEK